MAKKLVAYFSASGSTARLAQTLAVAADAALYEIRPAVPYKRRDLNWMDKKARSTVEMADPNCRVAMADTSAPVAETDVIFLGFPIWWGREPSIVDTFLESYDFAGKAIVPFCTSGGNGIGFVGDRIKALLDGKATVVNGQRMGGETSAEDLKIWADGLDL